MSAELSHCFACCRLLFLFVFFSTMLLVNKGVHLGRFYARKNCNPATYDSWHLVVKFTIVYAVVSFWSLASGCFRWGSFISRILSNAYDYDGDGDCSRTAQTQAWCSDAALPDARWTTDLPSSIRRLYDHYRHRRRRRLITCRPPGRQAADPGVRRTEPKTSPQLDRAWPATTDSLGGGRSWIQAGVKRSLVPAAAAAAASPPSSFDRETLRSAGQRDAGASGRQDHWTEQCPTCGLLQWRIPAFK